MTSLQTAHLGLVVLLERWRETLSPREYTVLVDLVWRWLEVERDRNERAHRRWAA
jgi:hypothetical protein